MGAFHPTTTTYKQGAKTLTREYYTSPSILSKEIQRLFSNEWNCVGRASNLSKPGDYFLCEVAGESIIVVRDQKNILHAFFNVCRHRGTRICQEQSGNTGRAIQCPYHAWTYSTDGNLITAPYMNEVGDFNGADYGLHNAAIAEWEGFLFVNIGKKPKPFEQTWHDLVGRLARYNIASLKPGHSASYDIAANWKLVFQNYNECLHCPTIHPKLSMVLPYKSGANDLVEGKFLGGYMDIREPNKSATMNGEMCGVLTSEHIPAEDQKRAYYYSFMPNMLLSIHPDYVNFYMITPITTDRTLVESQWLFPQETIDNPNNNIAGAVEFWDMTNRQDWDIIERSQLGISSSRYVPGPYSPRESIPAAWDRNYLTMMGS